MDNSAWAQLFNKFYPSKLAFESNKHLFTKIAFDVFQLNSSPVESLWILEEGEDGKQYLSATYSGDDDQKEAVGNWNALPNKESSLVILCYKNFPIHKFASSEFGFNKSDIQVFQKALMNKINSDQSFVQNIIDVQPKEKKDLLFEQFPELMKK